MTENELYLLLISVIIILCIIISLFIYFRNKFVTYMHSNYKIFNVIINTHDKYRKKLIKINRTVDLGLHYTDTKYKFDNYKLRFDELELTKFYNHFIEVKEVSSNNLDNRKKYQKELLDVIAYETGKVVYDTNKYSFKKQKKYLSNFIMDNEKISKEYQKNIHYETNGIVQLTLRYTSPKGRNSYRRVLLIKSSEINQRYHKEVVLRREEERIKHERRQNKLYHNKIYMYSDRNYSNMICIGQTTRKNVEDRIRAQYKLMPIKPYIIHHFEFAQYYNSEKWFTDRSFHRYLEKNGYDRLLDQNGKKTEWFKISIEKAIGMLNDFKNSK